MCRARHRTAIDCKEQQTLNDYIPKRRPADKLSGRPSCLIRQCVNDVKWAIRAGLVFNMGTWAREVMPLEEPQRLRCEVCLAGASLVRRVLPRTAFCYAATHYGPANNHRLRWGNKTVAAGRHLELKLIALERLRHGRVQEFVRNVSVAAIPRAREHLPRDAPALVLSERPTHTEMQQWCRSALALSRDLRQIGC